MALKTHTFLLIIIVSLVSIFSGSNAAISLSVSQSSAALTTASPATKTSLGLATGSPSLTQTGTFGVSSSKVTTVPDTTFVSVSSQLKLLNTTLVANVSSTAPAGNSTKETSTPIQRPFSTVYSAGPSATTTLLPAVHWDLDLNNLSHIDPRPSGSFYYAEQPGAMDPNLGGQFAQVTSKFTYPSVILEHSGFIDQVTCGPSQFDASIIELAISFSSQEAYQTAKSNWALHINLVLITSIPDCGVPDRNQRAFWKTSTLDYDDKDLNIYAAAKEIPLQESVEEMDLEWGNYEPTKQNSTFFIVTDKNGTISATCAAPARKVVDGFPTAPCGPDFDKLIDDFLGYVNGTSLESRTLNRRCHWSQVACLAREALDAPKALKARFDLDPHWDPSISKSININLGPSALISTPFGQAYKLFLYSKSAQNYIAAYCIDCGVHGTVTLSGKASLTLLHGITSAQVGMNGHLSAGLYFGIDAQGSYAPPTFKQTLWSTGLPGLSVPGIYSLGPTITVGVELSASVTAGGQVQLGASLEWPAFAVTLDLVSGKKSQSSGITPQISSKFQATGHISASAVIGLPISIAFVFEVDVIKYHKALEIVEEPGLTASLTFNTGKSSSCNNGISSIITFTNNIYISVFDITKFNLESYKSASLSHCQTLRRNVPKTLDSIKKSTPHSLRASRRAITKRGDPTVYLSSSPPLDTIYTTIFDTDLNYKVLASADGNLYLSSINASPPGGTDLFALSQNSTTFLGDSLSRAFHYYPDTLSKYGVSRLRLSSATSIPKTASLAALVLVGNADGHFDGKSILAIITPDGTLSYPALCTYRNKKQVSKVFMVRDVDAGPQELAAVGLQNVVTGGEVDKCVFVPLTLGHDASTSYHSG